MPGPVTAPAALPLPPEGHRDPGVPIRLVRHSRFCLRLRWRLGQLRDLLDGATFWARRRSIPELRRMLAGSQAVVTAWQGSELVGFGRATSDGVFRAVLWDVVVAVPQQGQGLGRSLVQALLQSPAVARAERVYLMTTNSAAFYAKLGFHEGHAQHLMVRPAQSAEGRTLVSGELSTDRLMEPGMGSGTEPGAESASGSAARQRSGMG